MQKIIAKFPLPRRSFSEGGPTSPPQPTKKTDISFLLRDIPEISVFYSSLKIGFAIF